ncbi:unannotated protein [freshwater metagenome]|uniref:Unannotated protein n=1 Tax=freshwater metagenome TaxID=449393 RepID=A0A6J7BLX7_9ZZZZ
MAAADREPVHRGDGRLRDVADDPVKGVDLKQATHGGAVVACFGALLLVASGAEGLLARAGEGDGADLVAAPRALEAQHELIDSACAEGVVPVRPVDGDPGQSVVDLVGDVSELIHDGDPSFRVRCVRGAGREPGG